MSTRNGNLERGKRSLVRGLAALSLAIPMTASAGPGPDWQDAFDAVPQNFLADSTTTVQSIVLPDQRTLPYGLLGPVDGEPVLMIPGTPSGEAQSVGLESYLSSIQQENLRIVTPGKPGNGVMPADFDATIDSWVDDAVYLMQQLGYTNFKVLAISGGGPYADNLLTRYPDKVELAVFAAAIRAGANSATLAQPPGSNYCPFPSAQAMESFTIPNPAPPGVPPFCAGVTPFLCESLAIVNIPGFLTFALPPRSMDVWSSAGLVDPVTGEGLIVQDTQYTVLTQNSSAGFHWDMFNFCNTDTDAYDYAAAQMPVYLHTGSADTNVLPADMAWRETVYPNVVSSRVYEGETHAVWTRAMGQILLELGGRGNRTLLCKDGASKEMPSHSSAIQTWLANDEATLDICPWAGTPGE